jgi:flagellar motor switch/type III secretory pathway protein FliN
MNQDCRPLAVASLSPGLAALTRLWHKRDAAITFTAGGRTWILAPEIGPDHAVWKIRICARLGDDNLAVFLDNPAVADWPGSGLDVRALGQLPPELAGPALELACLELIEALEVVAGEPVSLTSLNLEAEESKLTVASLASQTQFDDALPFGLTWEPEKNEVPIHAHGLLLAPLPCLEKLAALFDLSASATSRGYWPSGPVFSLSHFPLRDFPLTGRIALPGPELSGQALLDLEPDDIVLTRIVWLTETSWPVRLIFPGGLSASACLNERTLRLESVMSKYPLNPKPGEVFSDGQDTMTDPGVEAKKPGGELSQTPIFPLRPEDIPIRLEFDLGAQELSLAQLAQLGPGSVLETDRDTAAPVRILASSRVIGLGELVDVAGRIGVRIKELYLKDYNAAI